MVALRRRRPLRPHPRLRQYPRSDPRDLRHLRLTELAERARTTKQAMLYTVNQLEAAGYVERVADPTDGRAKIVRLTERGWEVRRAAGEIITGIEGECARRLGERKMRQFEDLMKEISSVLQEDREQG